METTEKIMQIIEIRAWVSFLIELGILYYVAIEFYYDKNKDEAKKQKRTKTTKKVTQTKDGSTVTEEATETSEPLNGEIK